MQTDLLHSIGDVGPCEGQVLESPCNAPKLGSVLNRRPGVCSELRLEVDRSCRSSEDQAIRKHPEARLGWSDHPVRIHWRSHKYSRRRSSIRRR
jgi:hypothetical protein